MRNTREVRRELGEKHDRIQQLLDVPESTRSAAQRDELDRLDAEVTAAVKELRRVERQGEREDYLNAPATRRVHEPVRGSDDERPATVWRNVKTGEEVRNLTPRESVRAAVDGHEDADLSVGRYLQGLVTGNWSQAPKEQRLLQVGTFTSGGALVPAPLDSMLIDLARSRSVVIAMGAGTIPMESATLDVACVRGDPTAQWMGGDEVRTAGITESQGTFGRLQFQSQTVAILERISIELFEDAMNGPQVLEEQIGKALGLAIDKAVLYGIEGRDGLRQWSTNDATNSINEVTPSTNGDQVTSFAKFISGVQKCLEGNFPGEPEQLGLVWAPRTWSTVNALVEGANQQPLRGPDWFQAMKKMTSTQISITETQGNSSVASTAFVGDWSQVVLGIRTNPVIELSRQAGDAFSRLHVMLRIYARVDFQVFHPKFLCRIPGLIP